MSLNTQGQSFQRNLLSPCFILKMEAEGIYDTLACNIQTIKTAHCQSLKSQSCAVFIEE